VGLVGKVPAGPTFMSGRCRPAHSRLAGGRTGRAHCPAVPAHVRVPTSPRMHACMHDWQRSGPHL